ncbi:helix-turn-helix domain-containing protein [Rhizobium sp. S95]|uniref:Helix-turn-helix domain-containing protein n=1 Tax=Ciceribacter sichuanensis TaxID=2949647 RepID=A0AAJ1F3E2_9HYPH|nr:MULTISPECIES: helix-turn-helix domain-containing protein [unclassified Ciceribacter]MCM2395008.1 helix-turn-helix domain-containing protein [Ciceribacter sp. S95]MCM2402878.1 helix-turn-helix domain-containing protein [Ciceribacter sp. S153]MCO5955430.1 helix-turn-helix domain-containing protein [Ciceribacter sp. S101]
MFSIGDLSRRTGVKVPTIRYYEQMGLIAAADRTEGNQRRYEQADLERLAFIRHARDLGFPIDAIRELLALSRHPDEPCERADDIAREQLVEVREKIARLRKLEDELERIASHCGGHSVGDCYVIRALSDHGLCNHEH